MEERKQTERRRIERELSGIVKWFNDAKGYGLITPDDAPEHDRPARTAWQVLGRHLQTKGQRRLLRRSPRSRY